MKRYILPSILSLTALFYPTYLLAETLTPTQSLDRATATGIKRVKGETNHFNLVFTQKSSSGSPCAYIFNSENREGYIIASADDMAYPVLGYSNTGEINPEAMPPQLSSLLEQYAAQIEYARSLGLSASAPSRIQNAGSSWAPIAPMIKAKWNQSTPYNNLCPEDNGQKSFTGCVATSMAQVLNYFQYPERAKGSVSYSCKNLGETLSMDLGEQAFDWSNMKDYYDDGYTSEEADAVAYLMKACGYSVEMNYSPSLSTAYSYRVPSALIEHFNYAESCRYESRKEHSGSEWAAMIYDNLKNVGPIIYDATSPLAGGHSFVCDGYDGNGYFHFNWGWSGSSDGYYSLDALNPESLGTGVGSVTGFNIDQDAVLGIRLPDGNDYSSPSLLFQFGSTTATLQGNKLVFGAQSDNWGENPGISNQNANPVTVRLGAIIKSLDEGNEYETSVEGLLGNETEFSLLPYTMRIYSAQESPNIILPSNLPDGNYSVTLASCDMEFPEKLWMPVKVVYGNPNYVLMSVENGVASVFDVTPAVVEIPTAEFTTGLYYTRAAAIEATIVNDSDFELTKSLTPVLLYNGSIFFRGETILVTLNPGETLKHEWVTKFFSSSYITAPTEFTLRLLDAETNVPYGTYGTFLMELDPGSPLLSLQNLSLSGQVETEVVEGIGEKPVYVLPNPIDLGVELSVNVAHGYLANQIILAVYEAADDQIWEAVFKETAFADEGNSWSREISVSAPEVQPGTVYALGAKYWGSSFYRNIGQPVYFRVMESGVDTVETDGSEWEYFNLQGLKVANPQKGSLLIRRNGNKTEKIIFSIS